MALFFLGTAHSCSTGSDPEDIIEEVFSVPAEYCLLINNGMNDIIMDVNAIVMNNLETVKDTIDDEIADCVTPVIHRTNSIIDSVVIDYGTSNCTSIGGRYTGKVIVDPDDENLLDFEIRFTDLVVNGFDVSGKMSFNVIGREAGRNFSVAATNVQFSFKDSDENDIIFPMTSYEATYTYVRSEEDDMDYVDDIYTITNDVAITYPDGALMTLTSQSDLTYAYTCKNVIGGTALFTLQNVGEGIVNYGGGDSFDDCDGDVSVSAEGSTITISL
ncbi:hypothetical protein [Marinifilum caeruleilacunae]|uniref:Lipoprotein n=1 Tax=Marinifilum caeruleilacunae TaxID=2499076 RepID=A0ABX1WRT9_9BACT|nr:hypothetical protein [Marinifilum caeruleilacunae]NOU58810.1 hypothetical protein [Marinifilum caeruleilacunae]